jgi:hypothetical protein
MNGRPKAAANLGEAENTEFSIGLLAQGMAEGWAPRRVLLMAWRCEVVLVLCLHSFFLGVRLKI